MIADEKTFKVRVLDVLDKNYPGPEFYRTWECHRLSFKLRGRQKKTEASSKLKLESRRSYLDNDWREAPDGCWEIYVDIHRRAALGEYIPAAQIPASCRSWLTARRPNTGAALIEVDAGQVWLLSDALPPPKPPADPIWPGTKVLGENGRAAVLAVIERNEGKSLSHKAIAAIVNTPEIREEFGLTQCKDANDRWVGDVIRKSKDNDAVTITQKTRRHRYQHTTRTFSEKRKIKHAAIPRCEDCRKEMPGSDDRQTYCEDACKQRAYRKRQKALARITAQDAERKAQHPVKQSVNALEYVTESVTDNRSTYPCKG